MRRPSFQWYPADWRNNANLRRCTWASRGAWVDVLGLFHDSDEYGVLRWPWKQIAAAIGCQPGYVRELIDKSVLKGCDGGVCESYIYTPRSGRVDGDPVVLIAVQSGPIWYSSRMVRDDYIRVHRATFGDTPKVAPMPPIGDTPTPSIGPRTRARPPPQSSSSASENNSKTESKPSALHFVPPDWVPKQEWDDFDEMRRRKSGKGWTFRARELAVGDLEKLRDAGEDIAAVLRQSTMRSYAGLFPVDGRNGGSKRTAKTVQDKRSATARAMYSNPNDNDDDISGEAERVA